MSAGSEEFPLKGLSKIIMRRLVEQGGAPTGPFISIHCAQNFDVNPDESIVPVPGNDTICYEFNNFNKFDIPINHGAMRMEDLPFFLGGIFTDGEDLAQFDERIDYQPIPCELWVQTDTASDGGNARYYEHYPSCKCVSWKNPRETQGVVQFQAQFSSYTKASLKRSMFRDKTGTGIPGLVSGDTTPPTLSSSDPANGDINHPVADPVVLTWSESMNPLSMSGIKLVTEGTGLDVALSSLPQDSYTEEAGPVYKTTLTPSSALATTDYFVFIPSSVQDANGNAKGASQFVRFTAV